MCAHTHAHTHTHTHTHTRIHLPCACVPYFHTHTHTHTHLLPLAVPDRGLAPTACDSWSKFPGSGKPGTQIFSQYISQYKVTTYRICENRICEKVHTRADTHTHTHTRADTHTQTHTHTPSAHCSAARVSLEKASEVQSAGAALCVCV